MKHTCLHRLVAAIVAATALLAGMSAYADPVEDLVEFTAGSTARADEVNGNFSEVANAVNDNDMRIVVLEEELTDLCAELTSELTGRTTIDQADFHPLRSTTVHEADGDGGRFCTNGFPWFQGVFAGLPHGARLTTFQFWTFDSSSESITGVVVRTCNQDFATPQLTVLGSNVSVGSAGYDTAIVNANPSFVDIDGQCTYSVQYRLDGQESAVCSEGDALRLVGAQARWIREPSPALAAACGID